ncbi:proteasome subunit beta type-6 [Falco peregrinus]|uniref:proteasome subunit beta type-6 n=1 Tax=Falco peregrinus TaxID=8954 RepID=UPI00247898F3|nr:proteasome subunit beta type-6 [Falco peregrinus]
MAAVTVRAAAAGPGPVGLHRDWEAEAVSTGTTIMAVEFDGGVIIGADSRTTTGSYVANRVTDKLTPVHDRIFCCRSGSAADTQAVADAVAYQLAFHSVELEEPPRVRTAARLFQQTCYPLPRGAERRRHRGRMGPRRGGQVYVVPMGGAPAAAALRGGGVCSSYIYGFLDAAFRPGMMSRPQCQEFVARALALAMARDGSSGGGHPAGGHH